MFCNNLSFRSLYLLLYDYVMTLEVGLRGDCMALRTDMVEELSTRDEVLVANIAR